MTVYTEERPRVVRAYCGVCGVFTRALDIVDVREYEGDFNYDLCDKCRDDLGE